MFTKKDTDFCKGIAIILMLFHHLFNDYEEYAGFTVSYAPFQGAYLTHLAMAARVCVAIFVFLSGYGITATYRKKFGERIPDKKELQSFVSQRYLKLMMGYWFVFILTLLCQPLGRTVTEAYGGELKAGAIYFLIDFMGLSNLFSTPTLNPTWWYMSLAMAIIVFMPFVLQLMQRFGAVLVMITSVTGLFVLQRMNPLTVYIFPMMLGAVCYECAFFEKINALWSEKKYGRFMKFFLEMALLLLTFKYKTDYNYGGILDGLMALEIALLVHGFFVHIPGITRIMQYLGKHSANMFLTHNQIYSFYFLGFFYSLKHWAVITVALILVSLFTSIVIEEIKRILRQVSLRLEHRKCF